MGTVFKIGAALAVALPVAAFAMTGAGGGPLLGNTASAGYGQQKVTLCHNGHTITVGAPAAQAHFAHGDTPGPC